MTETHQNSDSWRYRALFDHARHGVALLDGAATIIAWNRAAERLTGQPAAAAVGAPLAWLHAQDDAPWPADALAQAAAAPIAHAGWRSAADGTRYWCESVLGAMRDAAGELQGYFETFGDTTELRSAREALQEGPELFVRALRTAPVGVALQDGELRYTWAPMGVRPLGGTDGVDVVGALDADLYPPAAAARLTELKREVLAGGRGVRSELAVERDGDTRHFDVTLEPVRDDRGQVAGVSTVAFDVTDRKRVEEAVEHSRARLAEAERVAQFGSWEWDVATNQVVWSDGLYAIYGIDPAQFEGRYTPSSQRVHPDDHERVDAAVRLAMETGDPIDVEYRIVRPDGRLRRLRGRAEVIMDENGRPLRLAGTAQDVTEVRATADALQQTAADLGRRAAELQRLGAEPPPSGRGLAQALTARQLEILALVAEGLSNAEIGDRLFLSEGTVKWHVRKILRALGVTNRAQAVARYLGADRP